MKILVATRNKDKFNLVVTLLSSTIFKNVNTEYYNLDNLEEEITDKVESGDVIERSFGKAINAFSSIKINTFDYIVGIDDGIKLKGEIKENVKDYVKDIIEDRYLQSDELIYIEKAMTFINKDGKRKSIIIEIPFKYRKLDTSIQLVENSYPLNHVMVTLNSNKSVAEQTLEEANQYYLTYALEKLEEVRNFFGMN